jgi:DNA-directed RNA polymerase subunit RPC12/RpoP
MFKSIKYRRNNLLMRYSQYQYQTFRSIIEELTEKKMSSDVVYNCATCFKTVKGKQHYAICVSCSSRVHRKCYDVRLSNSDWTTIRQMFTCAACQARSRGSYCSDGERQLVVEQSIEKKRSVCQHPFHQQLFNTKL